MTHCEKCGSQIGAGSCWCCVPPNAANIERFAEFISDADITKYWDDIRERGMAEFRAYQAQLKAQQQETSDG
jgi:hypothetical protein